MFTGIIERLGTARRLLPGRTGLEVSADLADLRLGESVAVNGVCLTATRSAQGLAAFDLSPETLSRTTLGALKAGDKVNLERALRLCDRVGGHLVTGHVDGKGRIVAKKPSGGGQELTVLFPAALRRFLAVKGSIAVEGVSLTVAGLRGNRATVALVPFTLRNTNLGGKRMGDEVNLEIDLIARYLR